MAIQSRRIAVTPDLGELIERMKIVSLCPVRRFMTRSAKWLLLEVPNDMIDEAVLYLKLSGFLSEVVASGPAERRFSCSRLLLGELKVTTDPLFYSKLLTLMSLSKNPGQHGQTESTMATCAFFLDFEADISLEIETSPAAPLSLSSHPQVFNRPSMTNASRALKYYQSGLDSFSLTDIRIGLPNLPDFENPYQIPMTLFDTRPRPDFRNYPGCSSAVMFGNFMELYVVLFQTQLLTEKVLMNTRLVYGFVCQRCARGARFGEIVSHFANFGFSAIANALQLLEQFRYVIRVHSLSVEPVYVTDIYAGSHLIAAQVTDGQWQAIMPHFWVNIHGEIDVTLQTKVRIKTAELIDASPGIEILQLAKRMSSLTVADLLLICDTLELDEVVYSVYGNEQSEGGLFDSAQEDIVAPVDNPTLLYWIALNQRDPTVPRITRRLYSTAHDHLRLALGLANVLGSDKPTRPAAAPAP
jgi:hypothetical protein